MNNKSLAVVSYVAAGLFIVLGFVYFTTPANHLPAFLPGHDAAAAKVHVKHGLAALFLGLGCVAFGWFQGGPKSAQKDER